jgi:hypothetical protein
MKNIDIKSLIIGALFTSTVLLGMGAVSGPASTTFKLDGPIDLRLGFGSSKPSSSNTSTPTELGDRAGNLSITLLNGPPVVGFDGNDHQQFKFK